MKVLSGSSLRRIATLSLSQISERLRRGITVPATGINISLNVTRRPRDAVISETVVTAVADGNKKKTLDDVALKILNGHIHAVLDRCPAMKRFHHPLLETDWEKASAFAHPTVRAA